MSLIKPKALTLATYSLINLYLEPATAYVTPWIDRTTLPTFAEFVSVQLLGQSGGVLSDTSKIHVWVAGWSDISAGDNPISDVTNQVLTYSHLELWRASAIEVGNLDFSLGDLTKSRGLRFNVAKAFGGVIPVKFAVILQNRSGIQVRNPGAPVISVQGFQAETV